MLFLQTIGVVSCVVLVALLTEGMFGHVGGGVRMSPKSWFGWHPVLMTLSFGCLMPMGRFAYTANSTPWGLTTLTQRRNVHNVLMVLAVLAMLGGYLSIFMAHWPIKKFFGYSFQVQEWGSASRVIHSLLGYLVIFMALAQGLLGQMKRHFAEQGARVFTFHGTLGKAIIVLGAANITIAVQFWMWSHSMKAALYVLTAGTIIVGAVLPRFMDGKLGEEQPLMPDGEDKVARSLFNPAPQGERTLSA